MIPKLLGFGAFLAGVIMLFLAGVNIAASWMAMHCEQRWAESYEWKYERPYCKIKVDGKWIPEEYFRINKE